MDVGSHQAGVAVDLGQVDIRQRQALCRWRHGGLTLRLAGLFLWSLGLGIHQASRPLPLGGYLGENAVCTSPWWKKGARARDAVAYVPSVRACVCVCLRLCEPERL